MATVHAGRVLGAAGFSRTVAIKRIHPHLAKDPEFVAMFVDAARLAARIYHSNVVSTLDVVALSGELFVVMEYVHGESLASLTRAAKERGVVMPVKVAARIAYEVLSALDAAHEAKGERGHPLGIVQRDVSPQNAGPRRRQRLPRRGDSGDRPLARLPRTVPLSTNQRLHAHSSFERGDDGLDSRDVGRDQHVPTRKPVQGRPMASISCTRRPRSRGLYGTRVGPRAKEGGHDAHSA
jgi:serine/threonine protein kinase